MCNLCKLDHLLKYFVLKIVFANLNGVKHTAEAEWKPHLLLCWKYQSHDSWLTLPFKDSFEHISEHLDARKDAAWPPASKATPSPFRQGFSDKLLTSHSFEKDTRELKITCCCKYLQIWNGGVIFLSILQIVFGQMASLTNRSYLTNGLYSTKCNSLLNSENIACTNIAYI